MRPPVLPPRPQLSTSGACYIRYHSDAAVAQYCDAHFGPDKFGVPNFPARLAKLCCAARLDQPLRRALDLGCAVGRASFELATRFEQVDAVDSSSRFIETARRLQQRGSISYALVDEGEVLVDRQVRLADFSLERTARRIDFAQGNALDLASRYRDYDLVLAANLIDRLPAPGDFLAGIHQLLALDGTLAIASPYNWTDEFTPPHSWLGGRFRCGKPLRAGPEIERRLARHFEPVGPPQEVEFVLRETARTYQHGISQLTLWRRVR